MRASLNSTTSKSCRPPGVSASSAFFSNSFTTPSAASKKKIVRGRGPLAILLIVFLGGLAAESHPCVLPMIPINLASSAPARRRLARARIPARDCVRRRDGARLRSPRSHRHPEPATRTINSSPCSISAIAILFVVSGSRCSTCLLIDFSSLFRVASVQRQEPRHFPHRLHPWAPSRRSSPARACAGVFKSCCSPAISTDRTKLAPLATCPLASAAGTAIVADGALPDAEEKGGPQARPGS